MENFMDARLYAHVQGTPLPAASEDVASDYNSVHPLLSLLQAPTTGANQANQAGHGHHGHHGHDAPSKEEVLAKVPGGDGNVDVLLDVAQKLYCATMYEECRACLSAHRVAAQLTGAAACDPEQPVRASYGQLCSAIMLGASDVAQSLMTCAAAIDQARIAPARTALHRLWWLHAAVVVLFDGSAAQSPARLQALQLLFTAESLALMARSAPHLLRYTSALAVMWRRLRGMLRDVVAAAAAAPLQGGRAAQRERERAKKEGTAADECPIVSFLVRLLDDHDLAAAQTYFASISDAADEDSLLKAHKAALTEGARLLVFETYSQLHQKVEISSVAEALGLGPAEAEVWLARLIQGANVAARIDSEKNRLVITKQAVTPHQQILDTTAATTVALGQLASELAQARAHAAVGLGA